MGSNAVDNCLRAGRLHRLHPGVYAVGHRVVSREGHWMAAVLACGDGAVLSHRSAAVLWGIATFSGAIEVTTSRDTRSRGAIRRHCALLAPDEVVVLDGIPVTSVHRTLFDYAAVSPVDRLEAAIRGAEYRRLWDHLSLLPYLLAIQVAVERESTNLSSSVGPDGRPTRSDLEELFLPLLDRFRPAEAASQRSASGARRVDRGGLPLAQGALDRRARQPLCSRNALRV